LILGFVEILSMNFFPIYTQLQAHSQLGSSDYYNIWGAPVYFFKHGIWVVG
jgi:hypothetical protein